MEVKLKVSNDFGVGVVIGASAVCLFGLIGIFYTNKKKNQGNIYNSSCSSTNVFKSACGITAKQDSEGKGQELEVAADRDAFWFCENMSPFLGVRMSLKRILFEGRSSFQRVQVIETNQFGKTLVMDGQTQSAESDEKVYHESLVHPSLLLHPNPVNVFIGGGGEFATAREVLRHKSVKKCVMVDIDKLACDICRSELPEWNDGAYEDKRFSVYYDDAKKWLEENEQKFDIIILDICDPIEAGPGYKLYTKDFYEFLETRLTENGIVVTQSGPGSVFNAKEECFTVINNTLRSAFKTVLPYVVDVPSFGCNWGFNIGTNSTKINTNILEMKANELDEKIKMRINQNLYFLDGTSLKGLFGISKSIREECLLETRVMTIDNPVFMYSS